MQITSIPSQTSTVYSAPSSTATSTTKNSSQVPVDTFVKATETPTQPKVPYSKPKRLSDDEIQALKESQAQAQSKMLEDMMGANISNQSKSSKIANNSKDLITKIFGSYEKGLPPLPTTQEGAKAALAEGGAYSVDSVATRIMDMAKSLAGGDASKFDILKGAVQKGFKQAGLDFEKAENQKLPQICQDTYTEIMQRFDVWQKELNV